MYNDIEYVDIPCNKFRYKEGRSGAIRYIVVHYTAGDGDTAKQNCLYFKNHTDVKSSAHVFVDEGDTIYRSVPFKDTAYAVGAHKYKHKYCRNYNSVSVEMSSKKYRSGIYYIEKATKLNCIRVVYDLMLRYNIPLENVIRHYDVTGKLCPAPLVDEEQWRLFKLALESYITVRRGVLTLTQYEDLLGRINDVSERLDNIQNQLLECDGVTHWMVQVPDWAKDAVNKALKSGVLKGEAADDLHLTDTMLRVIVMMNRLGLFKEGDV